MSAVPVQDFVDANEANVRMLVGSFIDKVECIPFPLGTWFSTWSSTLGDYAWNYSFTSVGPHDFRAFIEEGAAKAQIENSLRVGRGFCAPEGSEVSNLFRDQIETRHVDTWLKVDRNWKHDGISNRLRCVSALQSEFAAKDMLRVFRKAYVDTIEAPFGYSGIEETQLLALEKGLSNRDPAFEGLVGYIGKEPAAIALVCFFEEWVGIYSVAVSPDFRRMGFGKEISAVATRKALMTGSKTVFLQTAPGTGLTEFYEKIGYQAWFGSQFCEFTQEQP